MSLNCGCPPGYVPDSSGLNCVKTTSVAAINNGTTYTISAGNTCTCYGVSGTRFYQDITALSFPVQYPSCGNHNLVDNAAHILTVQNLVTGVPLWGDGTATGGRLNNAGIWTNLSGTPTCEFIGFSACVDVPADGTYCIGIAADNATRFSVDSQLIVEIDNTCYGAPCTGGPGNCGPQTINGISYPSGTCPPCSTGAGCGNGFPFNYWHVFPITLTAGKHIITLEGKNYCCLAAFAAEVYAATPAQLAAMTTTTQLDAVTIFTTANRTGQAFQSGTNSGYSCPDGYSLDTCNPNIVCSIFESVPYTSCCFQLTNCSTQQVIVTSTDLSTYVGQVVTLQSPAGSWQVTTATDCTGSVPVVVTGNSQTCPACYRLVNCVSGAVIISSTDLAADVGQVVNLAAPNSGCWQVYSYDSCTGSVPVTVNSTSPTCTECLPCFVLTNCKTGATIQTNSPISGYVGQTVQIEGYPEVCWTVTASSGCRQVTPVIITSAYSDCASCLPNCYLLINCVSGDPTPTKITNTDLSAYVGQVIQIKDCVGQCWTVQKADTCVGAEPIVVTGSFKTCVDCNPPLVCPPPELLHQRKVKPGYNTPNCSPEYTDEVNCNFAEQIWNLVKSRRYGINTCCSDDLQKYIIKKELLDLDAIYDKNLCITCPPITCCTPCPVPPLPVPPIPIVCAPPKNLVATIEVLIPCFDATGPATAVIVFNKATTIGFHPPK